MDRSLAEMWDVMLVKSMVALTVAWLAEMLVGSMVDWMDDQRVV